MARTAAAPRPQFVYFIDHALRIELKVKSYIKPLAANDSRSGFVCEEITTWEYALKFGTGRSSALFKGNDFVTFHTSPDMAVIDLMNALLEWQEMGRTTNAAQKDWIVNVSRSYREAMSKFSAMDIPGAEMYVTFNGVTTERMPVDHMDAVDALSGDVLNLEDSTPTGIKVGEVVLINTGEATAG